MLTIDSIGVRRIVEEDGSIRVEAGITFASSKIVEKDAPEHILVLHEKELKLKILDLLHGDVKYASQKLYAEIAAILGNISHNRWLKVAQSFNSFWNAFDYLSVDENCKAAKYPRAILEMLYYDREIDSEQFSRLMNEVIADGR